MEVGGTLINLPALLVLGVVVGFLAGLFGVGGGFLLTPLLSAGLGVPLPIAVGTGLCQMVGSSTAAFLRYRSIGRGEPRVAILMLPGSLLGVKAGAELVKAMDEMAAVDVLGSSVPLTTLVLYGLYLVLLLSIAALLWRQGKGNLESLEYVRRGPLSRLELGPSVDLPGVWLRRVSPIVIAYVGLLLGLASGLLGVGGGIALIPILLYGFGFPFRETAGTGIAATFFVAVVGTWVHAGHGHVDLRLAMVLLVGAGISAQIGALASQRFSTRSLRKGLAVLILFTAVTIVIDLVREIA